MKTEGRCTIARSATVVTLHKTSKFAPVEEFAKQVGEQIIRHRPRLLGNKERALELQKQKAAQGGATQGSSQAGQQPQELLYQTYINDGTINVAEAARRSFVDISHFLIW